MIDPGYKVMLSCGEEIVEGLSRNLKAIALSLLAKDLISLDVYEETIKLNETNTDKARRLHLKVLKLVQQSPEKYEVFVEVFQQQQNQLCGDIVLALNTSYNQHGMTLCILLFQYFGTLQLWIFSRSSYSRGRKNQAERFGRSYCPRKRRW